MVLEELVKEAMHVLGYDYKPRYDTVSWEAMAKSKGKYYHLYTHKGTYWEGL